jgi:hypothetical protein
MIDVCIYFFILVHKVLFPSTNLGRINEGTLAGTWETVCTTLIIYYETQTHTHTHLVYHSFPEQHLKSQIHYCCLFWSFQCNLGLYVVLLVLGRWHHDCVTPQLSFFFLFSFLICFRDRRPTANAKMESHRNFNAGGWETFRVQEVFETLGAVYTMDHEVVPRKRPILRGTTSWDDFHGPSY